MRDFDDSTLWRISAFDRVRQETGTSGFARLGSATVLPTTLLSDLRQLRREPAGDDVLEVMAACVRHREPALLCVQIDQLVWPLTLFPQPALYHSPRDLLDASASGLGGMRLVTAEPPGVRPPGHWMHERIAHAEHYRPMAPMLWQVALYGPRRQLLAEIGGRAAYRLMPGRANDAPLPAPGALGPAIQRLQHEAVSMKEMSGWPGLNAERAARLLNGLYLAGRLIVSRSHPAARVEPRSLRDWLRGWK